MPHTNTQNEFNQNLHAVQNSNTRNSREMNLFSENNFRSGNSFHSQSVTVNDNFESYFLTEDDFLKINSFRDCFLCLSSVLHASSD